MDYDWNIEPVTTSEPSKASFRKEAAQRRFQVDPRQTIQWIRKRSFYDLAAAMCFGGIGYRAFPKALRIPLFEAILVNLEDFEWYNAPGPEQLRKLRHTHAWTLLFALIVTDDDLIANNDFVINMVIKSWPTVLKWLCILTEETNDDEVIILSKRKKRSGGIAKLLFTLGNATEKTDFLWKEEDTIAFAFRFWTRSNQDLIAISFTSLILTECIAGENYLRLERISNWSIRQIMELVISRIQFAIAFTQTEPFLVEHLIDLLDTITMMIDTNPLLPSMWLELDATSILIDIIRSSLSCRKTIASSEVEKQTSLVKCCFRALHTALVSFKGRQCREAVNMALRSGILEVLLLLSAHVTLDLENDEEKDFPLLFLLVYLPPLLTFSSCIRAAVGATERLGPLKLDTVVDSEGHQAYIEAWIDLQWLLCARVASKAYFTFNPPFYQCSNVLCKKAGVRSMFKKCGGCKARLFCSPECQKIAWKSPQGHRRLCAHIAKETNACLDILTKDVTHITLLAIAEVTRHMLDLRRVAKVEFPNVDFNSLCYFVNFATDLPTLKLETSVSITKKGYEHIVEDLVGRVAAYGTDRVALLRIDPIMELQESDDVVSLYRLVEFDKTGSSNADLEKVLEKGRALGGRRREPCIMESVKQPSELETKYDVIDEILRRAGETLSEDSERPLLCDDVYADVIEEEADLLLDEVGSSTRNTIYV